MRRDGRCEQDDGAVRGQPKGGNDTLSIAVKKGDCVEIDFRAKGTSLAVSGAGINVSVMGDDVSLVHATLAGTLSITVSAGAVDDYSLLVR